MKKQFRRMLTMILCVLFLISAPGNLAAFAEESDSTNDARALICTQHNMVLEDGVRYEQIEGDNINHNIYLYSQFRCTNCLYTEGYTEDKPVQGSHQVEHYTLVDQFTGLLEGYCVQCNYLVRAFADPIPND